jgi:hypothetical protein
LQEKKGAETMERFRRIRNVDQRLDEMAELIQEIAREEESSPASASGNRKRKGEPLDAAALEGLSSESRGSRENSPIPFDGKRTKETEENTVLQWTGLGETKPVRPAQQAASAAAASVAAAAVAGGMSAAAMANPYNLPPGLPGPTYAIPPGVFKAAEPSADPPPAADAANSKGPNAHNTRVTRMVSYKHVVEDSDEEDHQGIAPDLPVKRGNNNVQGMCKSQLFLHNPNLNQGNSSVSLIINPNAYSSDKKRPTWTAEEDKFIIDAAAVETGGIPFLACAGRKFWQSTSKVWPRHFKQVGGWSLKDRHLYLRREYESHQLGPDKALMKSARAAAPPPAKKGVTAKEAEIRKLAREYEALHAKREEENRARRELEMKQLAEQRLLQPQINPMMMPGMGGMPTNAMNGMNGMNGMMMPGMAMPGMPAGFGMPMMPGQMMMMPGQMMNGAPLPAAFPAALAKPAPPPPPLLPVRITHPEVLPAIGEQWYVTREEGGRIEFTFARSMKLGLVLKSRGDRFEVERVKDYSAFMGRANITGLQIEGMRVNGVKFSYNQTKLAVKAIADGGNSEVGYITVVFEPKKAPPPTPAIAVTSEAAGAPVIAVSPSSLQQATTPSGSGPVFEVVETTANSSETTPTLTEGSNISVISEGEAAFQPPAAA